MRRARAVPPLPMTILLLVLLPLAGCAAAGPAGGAAAAPGEPSPAARGKIPEEARIDLTLVPGQSWKSRFLSTSEVKRTLTAADGRTSVRSRTVGLELIAMQTVKRLDGTVALIEVRESAVRILQDGKFVDAPFRRFHPPDPVTFTVDTATGRLDFSGMEKAYGDWMESIRSGPAGDILGKSFRQEDYVGQLKERYGTPFSRFAGKTLKREEGTLGEREFLLPFLGPGVVLGPIPVESSSRIEGLEERGAARLLNISGSYTGKGDLSPRELAARLADFGRAMPSAYRSSEEASGEFRSTVDMVSGREVRSTGRLRYTSSASFDGGALSEEILGKTTLEPAD